MDLTIPTAENMEFMITKIKEKLRILNFDAVQATSFNLDLYDDLVYIYDMVMKKTSFSPNEMQAIAEELGQLRK